MTSPVLRALREWLTIYDTSQELQDALGQPVSEGDVLRLALDGHLRLALYIPVETEATCHKVETDELDPDTERRKIVGLWKLPLVGRARIEVERQCQANTDNFPSVPEPVGAFVANDDWLCQLPPDRGAFGMSSRASSEFPFGSVLCVRRAALQDFLANNLPARESNPPPKPPEKLGQRERDSLLAIIAALMESAGISRAQTSKAAITIVAMTEGVGARVARRTVEEHLKRIPEALERRGRDED